MCFALSTKAFSSLLLFWKLTGKPQHPQQPLYIPSSFPDLSSNSPVSPASTYPGKHVTPIQQSYYICSQHLYRRDLALSSPLLYLFLGLPGQKLSQVLKGSYPDASPVFAATLGKSSHGCCALSSSPRALQAPLECHGKSWLSHLLSIPPLRHCQNQPAPCRAPSQECRAGEPLSHSRGWWCPQR